ncbi:monovalent cation/H(+) antiporter subunit G [soil metagenome]
MIAGAGQAVLAAAIADTIAGVLVLTGAGLTLLAAVGLQRFDDVFARMHAATKAATLGLILTVLGASLRLSEASQVSKLLLVIALQLLTAPVAAHLVGRAAYRSGDQLGPNTSIDELADAEIDPTDPIDP